MAIDFSLRFIPEKLTPLYFTSVYQSLTSSQRLRYNQLHACYFCEQIIFFEQRLGRPVLTELIKKAPSDELKHLMSRFLQEENEHSAMFRRLLSLSAPDFYSKTDFFFIHPHKIWDKVLSWVVHRPRIFPMLIWLQLLQEERAMHFSKCFLAEGEILEPEYLASQKKHLSDEIDHIKWDHELIDWLWPSTPLWLRKVNAKIFCWMVVEFFYTPKRAAVLVAEHLVQEFPELETLLPQMRNEIMELSEDPIFLRSLYSDEIVPNSYKRLKCYPEFAKLTTLLPEFKYV